VQSCKYPSILIAFQGWSFDKEPSLRFRNQVGKPKTGVNKMVDAMHIVGDELNEFEGGKIHKRNMFDRDVVYHIQSLEHTLDFLFSHLGLANESSVDYPLLLTEPLCNPNYTRANISELLFECYRVPAVSYAVDSLLSFFHNYTARNGCSMAEASKKANGLIVSSGYNVSRVIPVLEGQRNVNLSKRLNLGGFHHGNLLQRSLQLKYPPHKQRLTSEVI